MMKIAITIEDSIDEIKNAIALGWNERFDDNISSSSIKTVGDERDIVCMMPFIDLDKIKVVSVEE